MKKFYLLIIVLFGSWVNTMSQVRYLNEVFTSWQFAKDSVYANNFEAFPSTPTLKPSKCDIYQPPASDTATKRPVIVLLHTGSFLPKYLNQGPTGFKDDSATVELAKGFAKRGYVVCVPAFRRGWNPAAPTQEERAASIMQAVYRGEQDAKAAVRYMRKNAAVYKIDTTRIVLGGQGTGGYIALTYAYVRTNAETRLSKFIGSNNLPYIDTAALGDIDNLLNATYSQPNNPGFGSDVNMIFNLGGAIGAIEWMNAGETPVVGMHSYTDPFAPDTSGIVYVPGTVPQAVIPVDGSRNICRKATQLNLQPWKNCMFNDPYSTAALVNNESHLGYYRFKIPYPVPQAIAQAAPWEWWDSATTVGVAYATYKAVGTPDTTALKNAKACHTNGLATNQYMSKTKAMAYIDTIQNYLAPRIMVALRLPGYLGPCPQGATGVTKTTVINTVSVYPNPAHHNFTVKANSDIKAIRVMDISGRVVISQEASGVNEVNVDRSTMVNGVYIIKISTANGEYVQRLIVN